MHADVYHHVVIVKSVGVEPLPAKELDRTRWPSLRFLIDFHGVVISLELLPHQDLKEDPKEDQEILDWYSCS